MASAFVSYAREDSEFVAHLVRALQQAGQTVNWDQDNQSIAFSAPWQSEIQTAIRQAEKFVFVISPDSLKSVPCLSELTTARTLNKQVIPLLYRRPADERDIETGLGALNWIFFERADQFDLAVGQLIQVLETDLPWARAHARLAGRAEEWSAAGDDHSRLLRGSDLRSAEEWLAEGDSHPQAPPTATQRRFVAESRRASDRAARRWRGALAAGLVVAIALAAIALVQRNDARHQAQVARARELSAQATADLITDPGTSLELAMQALHTSASASGTDVLRLALSADTLRERIRPGAGTHEVAAWSPSTETIAATGADNRVQFWDIRRGRLLRTVGTMPASAPISQLLYSSDGQYLAAVSSHGRVQIYDTATGRARPTTKADALLQAARNHPNDPVSATWQPGTDALLVYGAAVAQPFLTYAKTGDTTTFNLPAPVTAAAFAPTGTRVALLYGLDKSAAFRAGIIADLTTFRSTDLDSAITSPWTGDSHQLCWTPDGSEIAAWNPVEAQDPPVHIFDATTGLQVFTESEGDTTSAAACGASADGPYLATGDYSGRAFRFQSHRVGGTGPRTFTTTGMTGHTAIVHSVATSSDGSYIATGSDDGTVRVWDAHTGAPVSLSRGTGPILDVGFSSTGGAVLALERNGTIDVFDAGIGEPAVALWHPFDGYTHAVGFLADDTLAYGFHETTTPPSIAGLAPTVTAARVLIWDAATGQMTAMFRLPDVPSLPNPKCALGAFVPPCQPTTAMAETAVVRLSNDGKLLAYADGTDVVLHTIADGAETRVPVAGGAIHVYFRADTHVLVAVGAKEIVEFDPATGHRTSTPVSSYAFDSALSADGTRLVTVGRDAVTTVFAVGTLRPIATLPAVPATKTQRTPPMLVRVAINHDGSTVAIGDEFGVVRLWHPPAAAVFATRDLARATGGRSATQYPVAELGFAVRDTRLIAVNWPQIATGDSLPSGSALVLDATTGAIDQVLASPGQRAPPWQPGVALSSDGRYLLGGIEGFAPTGQVPGHDAVYSASSVHELADLQGPIAAATAQVTNDLATTDGWSADATRLIIGAAAIYACDSCADPSGLQRAAALRLAWATPLTPEHDVPAGDNAFG